MFGCGLKYFSEHFNLKLERVYKTYALRMAMEIIQVYKLTLTKGEYRDTVWMWSAIFKRLLRVYNWPCE